VIASTPASLIAIACFGGTALVGRYVATRLPPGIDRAGMRLRGFATPLAAMLTFLGRWYAIVALAAIAAAAAAALQRPVFPVFALLASQVVAQGVVSVIKAGVRRARPARWLLRLESDSSFPSGHAVTSVVFFIGLIVLVHGWHVAAPATYAIACLLAFCALGIPWSRLALGAHYVTDVLGGLLFGTGWLLATLVIFAHAGLLRPV
jgi:membrane-associated phospholipid phosphatase